MERQKTDLSRRLRLRGARRCRPCTLAAHALPDTQRTLCAMACTWEGACAGVRQAPRLRMLTPLHWVPAMQSPVLMPASVVQAKHVQACAVSSLRLMRITHLGSPSAGKAHDVMALKCRGADSPLNFAMDEYAELLPMLAKLSKARPRPGCPAAV